VKTAMPPHVQLTITGLFVSEEELEAAVSYSGITAIDLDDLPKIMEGMLNQIGARTVGAKWRPMTKEEAVDYLRREEDSNPDGEAIEDEEDGC
jgi:hypothetical protein